MTMSLACKDTGMDSCPFVARGETVDETLKIAGEHGKAVHGYTDAQLNDPEMITTLKKIIKQE